MRRALAAACAALTLAATQTRAEQLLVKSQSQITFTSKQMGVPVEGSFRVFDASVVFDPRKPEAARIFLSIDLASTSLGSAEAQHELARPDWFNTKAFPQATFKSTTVSAAGAGRFSVNGKLSIKAASRDVIVPITLVQAGDRTTASGTFTVKRLDFRIGDGDWKDTSMVADTVEVNFRFVLTGVGPR
jgi:polyisoprenoid-binding protein YceI